MKYAIGGLIIFITIGLVIFANNFEVSPKIRKKIGPTVVDSHDQKGILAYKRLFQEIEHNNIVVLGFDSAIKNQNQIIEGFLRTATYYKKKFQVKYKDNVKYTIDALDSKYFSNDNCSKMNKCLVILNSKQSSRFYKDSFSEKNFLKNTLISITYLPVLEKEIVEPKCKQGDETSCAQFSFLSRYKKRKYKMNKDFVALEMHRDKDYYALVNQP